MNAIELLKEYLEREHHNVFCYSKTYTMDSPKKGYENEFYEAQEKVEILEKLIDDLEEGDRKALEQKIVAQTVEERRKG